MDHRTGWAMGGETSTTNMRLLCATHNQLAADKAYGADFMARKRRRS